MTIQDPSAVDVADRRREITKLLRQTELLMHGAVGGDVVPPLVSPLAEQPPASDYVEAATTIFQSVRDQVVLVNGQLNGYPRPTIDKFRRQMLGLARRGITLSVVCHPDELWGHSRLQFLEELDGHPLADVRVSTNRLQGMFVFDNSGALLWDPEHGRECLLVRSSTIITPLIGLIETAWQGATPLTDYMRCMRDELDEVVPQVLRLLGSGVKDEAAAREIGVSVRTYRRYVADLMERLDAGSRFQAGMRASSLGLTAPETSGCPFTPARR